jgi:DNA-binding transcriptional LysR family regulator
MIDKLTYLIALSREEHFGRAAESCGVTQPTLSAGVKQLEEMLGVMLVRRGSRFMGFTPEGERVLTWARRIVADSRAMRQEVDTLKRGLAGHITLAVIPTALPMVCALTAPFQERYPQVRFSIFSHPSSVVLKLLENLEIDAGLTYLDNEPLGRVSTQPIYLERYCLITANEAHFAGKERLTWAETGSVPLCLLTPDMQNRRIVDQLLRRAGTTLAPALESNSMIVLVSHVRTGRWASVMPEKIAIALGEAANLRMLPIAAPDITHSIGLVAAPRDPPAALVAALFAEARRVTAGL